MHGMFVTNIPKNLIIKIMYFLKMSLILFSYMIRFCDNSDEKDTVVYISVHRDDKTGIY